MRWEANRAVFTLSRIKILAYACLGAAIAAFSFWLWRQGVVPEGSFKELVLLIGGPLFGLATIAILSSLFGESETLIVDRQGILDRRISDTRLPWSMISDLCVQGAHRQSWLAVDLAPHFEAALRKTKRAQYTGAVNRAFGFPGVTIGVQGLDGRFEDLLQAVERFSPQEEMH